MDPPVLTVFFCGKCMNLFAVGLPETFSFVRSTFLDISEEFLLVKLSNELKLYDFG
jgi:hypothetical protein